MCDIAAEFLGLVGDAKFDEAFHLLSTKDVPVETLHAAIHVKVDLIPDLVSKRDLAETVPLTLAVAHGHVDLALKLIERGVHCDEADANNCCPLLYAAKLGLWTVAQALLERGAKPDAAGPDGTVYTTAAYYNQGEFLAQFVDWLKQNNKFRREDLDVPAYAHAKRTALHLAALVGNEDVCRTLLDCGARVQHLDKDKNNALHCLFGQRRLCCLDIEPEQPSTALVQAFLSKLAGTSTGALVAHNDEGYTPLMLAVLNNCLPAVEALTSGQYAVPVGTPVTMPGGRPLQQYDHHVETAIHMAARHQTIGATILAALLQNAKPADVNATAKGQGITALMYACQRLNVAKVRLLLKHGASVHARTMVKEAAYWQDALSYAYIGNVNASSAASSGDQASAIAARMEIARELLKRGVGIGCARTNMLKLNGRPKHGEDDNVKELEALQAEAYDQSAGGAGAGSSTGGAATVAGSGQPAADVSSISADQAQSSAGAGAAGASSSAVADTSIRHRGCSTDDEDAIVIVDESADECEEDSSGGQDDHDVDDEEDEEQQHQEEDDDKGDDDYEDDDEQEQADKRSFGRKSPAKDSNAQASSARQAVEQGAQRDEKRSHGPGREQDQQSHGAASSDAAHAMSGLKGAGRADQQPGAVGAAGTEPRGATSHAARLTGLRQLPVAAWKQPVQTGQQQRANVERSKAAQQGAVADAGPSSAAAQAEAWPGHGAPSMTLPVPPLAELQHMLEAARNKRDMRRLVEAAVNPLIACAIDVRGEGAASAAIAALNTFDGLLTAKAMPLNLALDSMVQPFQAQVRRMLRQMQGAQSKIQTLRHSVAHVQKQWSELGPAWSSVMARADRVVPMKEQAVLTYFTTSSIDVLLDRVDFWCRATMAMCGMWKRSKLIQDEQQLTLLERMGDARADDSLVRWLESLAQHTDAGQAHSKPGLSAGSKRRASDMEDHTSTGLGGDDDHTGGGAGDEAGAGAGASSSGAGGARGSGTVGAGFMSPPPGPLAKRMLLSSGADGSRPQDVPGSAATVSAGQASAMPNPGQASQGSPEALLLQANGIAEALFSVATAAVVSDHDALVALSRDESVAGLLPTLGPQDRLSLGRTLVVLRNLASTIDQRLSLGQPLEFLTACYLYKRRDGLVKAVADTVAGLGSGAPMPVASVAAAGGAAGPR